MRRKIIVAVVLLVASGYVLSLCFRGMNMASDLYYTGGSIVSVVWALVIVPLLWKLLTWRRKAKHDKREGETVSGAAGAGK